MAAGLRVISGGGAAAGPVTTDPWDYTFIATRQLDRQLRGGATPRSLYVDGRDPREVPDFMRSSFGVNIALVTADNWLVVTHRSHHFGVGKNIWNASANEGLHRHLDSTGHTPPDLFRVAERGIKEELCLDPGQYVLHLLSFAVVTSLSQWCALFIAVLDSMSRIEFDSHVSRGVADGWEHLEFDYVRFDPEHLVRYLFRDDRRSNWAPARFVLPRTRQHLRSSRRR